MLLHRYFGSHALETLRDAEFKTSKISSFNDSFEFLYVSQGETTPTQMRRFLDSHFSNPLVVNGLIVAVEKSSISMSDAEIRARIRAAMPLLIEAGVKEWPKIVKATELTLERKRQIIDEELRAVCFSNPERVQKSDEILLWSHYANKHQGVRVGWDLPDRIKDSFEIREITYEKNRVRVVWSLGDEKAILETFKAIERSATVKCSVWEYEKEFRLLTKMAWCKPREFKRNGSTTVEYFLGFPRQWVREVDFGVFCPESDVKDICKLLTANYPQVVPRKAEIHENDYAFDYMPIRAL